jgi:hypothetical protein
MRASVARELQSSHLRRNFQFYLKTRRSRAAHCGIRNNQSGGTAILMFSPDEANLHFDSNVADLLRQESGLYRFALLTPATAFPAEDWSVMLPR